MGEKGARGGEKEGRVKGIEVERGRIGGGEG